jgi:hypothetical protein
VFLGVLVGFMLEPALVKRGGFFPPRHRKLIVCLSGYTGAGKSTAAGYVSENFPLFHYVQEWDAHKRVMQEMERNADFVVRRGVRGKRVFGELDGVMARLGVEKV